MKFFCILAVAISLHYSAVSQSEKQELEITSILRMDWYPTIQIPHSARGPGFVKINGTSWGLGIIYKIPKTQKFTYRFGIGYYKYAFNNLRQTNPFGKSKNRVVEKYSPPGGVTPGITFTTDKYWYHTISVDVGLERKLNINPALQFYYGVEVSNYLTFAQKYHITYPAPNGANHRDNNFRYFGLSAKAITGLRKKIGSITMGINLTLPVYDSWHEDDIFPGEKNSASRSKWLRGVGIGVSCSFRLP